MKIAFLRIENKCW